ncbi:MAG: hypothetical protein AB7E47_03100 [Desulfovibrionaceae bacterium]
MDRPIYEPLVMCPGPKSVAEAIAAVKSKERVSPDDFGPYPDTLVNREKCGATVGHEACKGMDCCWHGGGY